MSPSILYSNKKAIEIYNTPNITNLKANNTNKNFPMKRDKSPINKNEIKKSNKLLNHPTNHQVQ